MTTNGIGLARLAGPLHEAGLDRVNVSLDTLDPETFIRLARRDRLGRRARRPGRGGRQPDSRRSRSTRC